MAFTTARASCVLSFGSTQDGLAPAANIANIRVQKGSTRNNFLYLRPHFFE
ncbi:MAG: hypothetical protein JWO06_369 [Bacteroidota bacterium]|nr:hypothetical protein [Bacteroidota bacterium]